MPEILFIIICFMRDIEINFLKEVSSKTNVVAWLSVARISSVYEFSSGMNIYFSLAIPTYVIQL
jgi:hypothetical protein